MQQEQITQITQEKYNNIVKFLNNYIEKYQNTSNIIMVKTFEIGDGIFKNYSIFPQYIIVFLQSLRDSIIDCIQRSLSKEYIDNFIEFIKKELENQKTEEEKTMAIGVLKGYLLYKEIIFN